LVEKQVEIQPKEVCMLKKIGIGLAIAAIVAAVGVGAVLAQEPTPADEALPAEDHGPGGPGGHGRPGGGRGGHLDVVAEALDMTIDELHEALKDGQTIAELAEAKGVALEDIADALVSEHSEHLQQAVEDGRLTQEEADEKLAEMEANILKHLESGEFGGPGRPGGHGMPGGPRSGRFGGAPFDVLAEALGMTVDELHDALADGQTVAELAEAKGVALEDIADALVAAETEHLQQAVEDGRLTQEEADEKIAQMEVNILERLESGEPGPGGLGGPGGCGGPGGMGGGSREGGRRGPRNPGDEAPVPEE
jgi:uncharacterized protein (DUF433 family)